MTVKIKYANRSKISEKKIREIIKLFSLDLDASQITKISGLNRNTINRYLTEIRLRISEYCQLQSPFSGEVEVDESYFDARRVKGNEVEEHTVKQLFLGSLSEVEKSILKSFQIVVDPHYKQ